jgi:hypothetical protein
MLLLFPLFMLLLLKGLLLLLLKKELLLFMPCIAAPVGFKVAGANGLANGLVPAVAAATALVAAVNTFCTASSLLSSFLPPPASVWLLLFWFLRPSR